MFLVICNVFQTPDTCTSFRHCEKQDAIPEGIQSRTVCSNVGKGLNNRVVFLDVISETSIWCSSHIWCRKIQILVRVKTLWRLNHSFVRKVSGHFLQENASPMWKESLWDFKLMGTLSVFHHIFHYDVLGRSGNDTSSYQTKHAVYLWTQCHYAASNRFVDLPAHVTKVLGTFVAFNVLPMTHDVGIRFPTC